jgi:hypothetical protein
VGDAHGMVVQYWIDGKLRSGWLDADAGGLVELPYNPTVDVTGRTVLTATHLVVWGGSGTVSVYSRDDLTTAVRTVPLQADVATHLLGMVGDQLLVSRYDSSLGAQDGSLPVWRVDALAPDGSTTKTVPARSRSLALAVPTPDGGLLVPGSAADTARRRPGHSVSPSAFIGVTRVARRAGRRPERAVRSAKPMKTRRSWGIGRVSGASVTAVRMRSQA